MDDREVVEVQIGRPPRSEVVVEARCDLGLPVVIGVPPILDDGTPFPTSHWLTCPLATLRISRLESDGGVKAADDRIATDADLRDRWLRTMERYRVERDDRIPADWEGPRPSGGVAGSRLGVKCLHAQYADTAAGGDNPIGENVAAAVGALDCATPCVVAEGGLPVPNPNWTEPA